MSRERSLLQRFLKVIEPPDWYKAHDMAINSFTLFGSCYAAVGGLLPGIIGGTCAAVVAEIAYHRHPKMLPDLISKGSLRLRRGL
jgi:hypothetical protein